MEARIEKKELILKIVGKDSEEKVRAIRKYLLHSIPTYAVGYVIFEKYNGVIVPEIIAHILGMTIIVNENLPGWSLDRLKDTSEKYEYEFLLKCQATDTITMVTHEHITDLDGERVDGIFKPFVLTYLSPGQSIDCKLLITRGSGQKHVKWLPIAAPIPIKDDDGMTLRIKSNGMLKPESIREYIKNLKV
jgi:RNA polymerase Rpb3/Rpb11 dimerisation domain